ncbi:MAG TPA: response regulator [Herpetosiphonaceae bacterium]|nr:response regulator [Herpetosiphonaceae bacterium]
MTTATQAKDILVVEDSPVVRSMLTHIIQDEGYRVESCNTAEEALDYLGSKPAPRLILLDLMLPYMRSDEFLQHKQADASLAAVPVVIISSYAYDEPGVIPGTVAYLEKPIDLDALMGLVRRYCDQ